ncbi:MAG: hypothetical protein IJC75_04145 [Oscillospiraceae bacterium]|nr:hypothetical protein [Oscillospiraceae bacterium]
MSIEPLKLVTIGGTPALLNPALQACLESGVFHLENAGAILPGAEENALPPEDNPYAQLLKDFTAMDLQEVVDPKAAEDGETMSPEFIRENLERIAAKLSSLKNDYTAASEKITEYRNALLHLQHLKGTEDDLGKVLQCRNIVCKFGRMPAESLQKLELYNNPELLFRAYDVAHDYAWGFYFTTPKQATVSDGIMKALLFEEFHIPAFIHGTPQEAMTDLQTALEEQQQLADSLKKERTAILQAESQLLSRIYRYLLYREEIYRLRSQCLITKDKFTLMGYVPITRLEDFRKCAERVEGIVTSYEDPPDSAAISPPVKLKNNRFSAPFSMFVEMYGLPDYRGFNPTTLLAVTYTILFGLMFGDLGQGLVMAIIGFVLGLRKKKIALAPILTRIGISSAVFGLLYGSVFGYEHWLDPVFHNIGMDFLPLHAMEHTDWFIYGAIGIGAVIMLMAITVNIIVKLRRKDYADAIFGNNGVMGFIFFAAILGVLVCMLFTDINLLTAPYVICLLVLPLLMMFFREPLGALVARKPMHHTSVVDFIASNFFECFEFILGYATNMLSFIRVGGFVFSHAGLMSVVMVLSEMMGEGASVVVVIIGNLFVMCLEGLIVGIQVLRLEFYEIFSRCYDGKGKPFTPIAVRYPESVSFKS